MCYYVSKLPGPPALPIIGNAAMFLGPKGEKMNTITLISTKYYPIGRVWLGPIPVLFIIEPKLIQELLTNHKYLEKAFLMKMAGKEITGDSVLISNVPKWKHNRSIVIRGFSTILLKSYFKIFVEKVEMLTKKLDVELNSEKSFDIFEYISRASLDAVCGSTMGVNVHAQEANSSYFDAMQSSLHLMIKKVFFPLYHVDLIFQMSEDYKQLNRNKSVIWGLTTKVINERRKKNVENVQENLMNNNEKSFYTNKKNEHKKLLLDYLMDISKSHPNFTNKQLEEEINLVIMAAYETSANALSYLLINLAANKNIQNKIYEEICNVLNESNQFDYNDLSKLEYMDMALKESMRLYSTVPVIGREVTQDIHFENFIIPKGVDVIIPIFWLHRDEKFWKNPLEFNPERFAPENIKNQQPYTYIPFSSGPRNCLGMRYAWLFMKTALTTLLRRYEFHTDLNFNEFQFEPEISLKLIGGHQIRITPRQR